MVFRKVEVSVSSLSPTVNRLQQNSGHVLSGSLWCTTSSAHGPTTGRFQRRHIYFLFDKRPGLSTAKVTSISRAYTKQSGGRVVALLRSPPAGASLINDIGHKLQSFADAMDSASLASAAASLLGNTLHLQGALYGKWDDSSTPIAERLMYELSQLRTVLQTLESASLAFPEPMLLADMPSALEESRKCLVSIGLKLLRCGYLGDSLDMETPAWSWETFDPGRQGKKMPWSRNEGESLVTDIQLSISKLRTWLVMTSHVQQLKLLQV
jgi:hypothetical protein